MVQADALLKSLEAYPSDPAEEQALVERYVDEATLPARTAAKAWQGGNPRLATGAELFLRGLDELAIRPLLELPIPTDAADAGAYIGMLLEPELALRAAIAARIDDMLDDRRPIPIAQLPGPEPEEPMQERRVCDEAYVAMQSLVYFGEDRHKTIENQRAFLSESVQARDDSIKRARDSAAWRRALGGDPD